MKTTITLDKLARAGADALLTGDFDAWDATVLVAMRAGLDEATYLQKVVESAFQVGYEFAEEQEQEAA